MPPRIWNVTLMGQGMGLFSSSARWSMTYCVPFHSDTSTFLVLEIFLWIFCLFFIFFPLLILHLTFRSCTLHGSYLIFCFLPFLISVFALIFGRYLLTILLILIFHSIFQFWECLFWIFNFLGFVFYHFLIHGYNILPLQGCLSSMFA